MIREIKYRGIDQIRSKTKHMLVVGMSGFGKDMFSEGYVARMASKGYKVFDLNSESRGEGMYYSLLQDDFGFKRI